MMASAKTILVVDDEQSLLDVLTSELKSYGYNVLNAKHGKQGYEVALKERPDLILLDILMPQMDGLKMLEELRRCDIDYCKTVPVIILTNLTNKDAQNQATKLGSEDYIIKSNTSLDKVLQLVKQKVG